MNRALVGMLLGALVGLPLMLLIRHFIPYESVGISMCLGMLSASIGALIATTTGGKS